ncbi:hypothetical protein HZA86_02880 [Candidatus Uhrbacteria bacterium]|nr:hypothetical protein [Candidatus Uhrbacteria bacterium]
MLTKRIIPKSIVYGLVASAVLLVFYFFILTFVSGWGFAWEQFGDYWYFIVSLAVGFGIQIGLYTYVKHVVHQGQGAGKVVAVSGTTSTAAMISCCTHYLVNIIPVLGVTGVASVVAHYQVQFFWVGLFYNLAGIAYIGRAAWKATPSTV